MGDLALFRALAPSRIDRARRVPQKSGVLRWLPSIFCCARGVAVCIREGRSQPVPPGRPGLGS
eukprot:170987-Pyramimonas_sp.AAC.1